MVNVNNSKEIDPNLNIKKQKGKNKQIKTKHI